MATVDNTNNSNTSQTLTQNDWVLVDGQNYKKWHDENGDYVILGGTQKKYLIEIYEEQKVKAGKARIQQDITGFFTKQENDFAEWSEYYGRKIEELTGKIQLNKSIFKASQEIAIEKEHQLNPLYARNNTNDIRKFWNGDDKKIGLGLWADRKHAKHDGNIALGKISTAQTFIETYRRLLNNSNFCLNRVIEIAQNTLKN